MKNKKKPDENSTDYFEKQLNFSMLHQSYKDCPYYPCHTVPADRKEMNCCFCYCPFYPCHNQVGTGKWIRGKKGERIWDCSSCFLIHRDEVVKRVLELIYENKNITSIKKTVRKEFPGSTVTGA